MLESRASKRDLKVIEDNIAMSFWLDVIDNEFSVEDSVVIDSIVKVIFFRDFAAALITPWLVEILYISELWLFSQS